MAIICEDSIITLPDGPVQKKNASCLESILDILIKSISLYSPLSPTSSKLNFHLSSTIIPNVSHFAVLFIFQVMHHLKN